VKTFTTEFDPLIQSAAARYLSGWGWLWWKAQLLQESQLDLKATSSAGAEGIAQLMPPTKKQLYRDLKFPATATAFDPEFAIPAGAYYMGKLRRAWFMDRTEDDRRRLAQASYNAGLGNIIAAQRAANNARDYASIIAALPKITGEANAAETAGYIVHIEKYFAQLHAALQPKEVHP